MMEFFLSGSLPLIEFVICDVMSDMANKLLSLLSLSLSREWLQIDTDLLRIITNTVDDLSGGTNIDDLEPPKYGF